MYPCFSKMALHGGRHLELKKMHKGDFWGLFGIHLGRWPGIIPEKISFLQFIPGSCVFFTNALALLVQTAMTVGQFPIGKRPSQKRLGK